MKTAYINGLILDGTKEMEPVRGKVILTDEERITAIAPQETDLTGYEIVDLAGKYIMPGLINLHVHLPASGRPKKKQTDNAKLVKRLTSTAVLRRIVRRMCEGYARTQLFSGVTTIRTVGGVLNFDTQIRDRIRSGVIAGPRILAANMAISVPGGHMAGSLAYEAHSAQEAAELVRVIAQDKPDLIKLMVTGGVLDARVKGEPGELKMPGEYIRAACDAAHSLGMKVAAHVESPEGVRLALANGVDSIEHGAKPDLDILLRFKEHGAFDVATLSPALPYALFDRSVSCVSEMEQFNGKVVFEGIIDCARSCLENGIPVGLGTDTGCPYVTHYDMWREINYFHQYCQVSNAFALHTATLLNAYLAGIDGETGSLAAGKCADMIVTKQNPLEDLQALRHIDLVVARGRRFPSPKVVKMHHVERELDKFL